MSPGDEKQRRRQAAARERARRNRELEETARQSASIYDWSGVGVLSELIRANGIRLGAIPRKHACNNATSVLLNGIRWPNKSFRGAPHLFRQLMLELGSEEYAEMDEIQLQDEMPFHC